MAPSSSVNINLKIIAMERSEKKLRNTSVPQNASPSAKRADRFARTKTYEACEHAIQFTDKLKEKA